MKKNLKENLKMNKNNYPFVKKLELILYMGPFFIGWVLGIWMYTFDRYEFKTAISGMIMLILYSILLIINHMIAFMDIGGYGEYPIYLDSILSLFYLGSTLYNTINHINGKKKFCPLHKRIIYSIERTVESF